MQINTSRGEGWPSGLSWRNPWSDTAPAYRGWFQIGGVSVQLASQRKADVAFGSFLDRFRIVENRPNIEVRVEWVSGLGLGRAPQLFDSGSLWCLYERGDDLQFDFSSPSFGERPYKQLLIDRSFRLATLYVSETSIPAWNSAPHPLDYPLDELLIMHRLTQEKAIALHGTGIVRRNGEANLFVGHSGAGKSTTTRLWTAVEDVEVLSDDRIIVRRDDDMGNQIPRFARNDNSKRKANSERNHNSKHKMRMYGTPWHGEDMYASPNNAPLTRIFILEHGHGNVLTQLSPSQAVSELFARSFVPFYCHEYVEVALTFLEEVARAVPCYRYAFEPQQSAVERILEFRD